MKSLKERRKDSVRKWQKKHGKEYQHLYRLKHKEQVNENSRRWYYTHKGIEYVRKYRKNNIELRRKWNREWIAKNRDRYNASKFIYRERTKREVLLHYSKNGKIECAKCGFSIIDALCLDHINNDGAAQRRLLKISGRGIGSGMNTYEAFKKHGYPEGLQILCANCNLIKEMNRKRDKRLQNTFYKERIERGDV